MLLNAENYREFLGEELTRRIRANSRYSQRAFARSLGMSPGELSEVLAGKRALSIKSALKISRALDLNPMETEHLLGLIHSEKGSSLGLDRKVSKKPAPRDLTLDLFRVVSDWYCFAILNLTECADFISDSAWIAQRLGISKVEVDLGLDRLERVGLIERKAGRIGAVRDFVMTPSGIPSEAIRNYHRQILQKASDALELQPAQERDISGLGMAVDPAHLDSIRKEIVQFRDHLVAKYSQGRKTEVYQLEIAFFRLSRKNLERQSK